MPRLLIVDDNDSIHQDFRKVLTLGSSNKLRNVEMELFGGEEPEPIMELPPVDYAITYAYQGDEAIELVNRAAAEGMPYAVVFMDVRMPPGMDGIKAAAEIWKKHPDTEMVICSAHSDYSWNDMLKEIGISDKLQFLRKPFDMVTVQQLALSCSKKWELEQTTKKYIKQLEVENRQKEDAQAKLARLNDELESRIHARTSELKKTNANLKDALAHLEEAQEQLVASEKSTSTPEEILEIAHEIGEPIDKGLVLAALLKREADAFHNRFQSGDINHSDILAFLQKNSEAAKTLHGNLNQASQIIERFRHLAIGEVKESICKFNALTYLKEVLALLQPRIKKTKIRADLQGDKTIELEGYPNTFKQIITHFVKNSLAHGYEPGASGHLFIRLISQGDAFILTYADDGKGMSPEHCRQIFDPLFHIHQDQPPPGRGLILVHNLVTQTLKGHITCNSQLGRGAMFTIKAPLSVEE